MRYLPSMLLVPIAICGCQDAQPPKPAPQVTVEDERLPDETLIAVREWVESDLNQRFDVAMAERGAVVTLTVDKRADGSDVPRDFPERIGFAQREVCPEEEQEFGEPVSFQVRWKGSQAGPVRCDPLFRRHEREQAERILVERFRAEAPEAVCDYLAAQGLRGRRWRSFDDGTFGCSSDYKDIGHSDGLANNLAFYTEGRTTDQVERIWLVLNVNQRPQAAQAHSALREAARDLAKRATGAPLPGAAASAINAGREGAWKVGGFDLELKRVDWPTGKGYELRFTVR